MAAMTAGAAGMVIGGTAGAVVGVAKGHPLDDSLVGAIIGDFMLVNLVLHGTTTMR